VIRPGDRVVAQRPITVVTRAETLLSVAVAVAAGLSQPGQPAADQAANREQRLTDQVPGVSR